MRSLCLCLNSKEVVFVISPMEKMIEEHTASVRACIIAPPQGCCPRCSEQVATFKRHDSRERFFRFIVEYYVHIIKSLLVRWKCPICGKTFTDYPSFALPHKRYILMDTERFSGDYVEDEEQTYRKVVYPQDTEISYKEPDDKGVVRSLVPSTLWRWISSLGSMKETLGQALHLIRQKDPTSSIFREIFPVSPHKYQSSQRKMILENARRLLRTGLEFHRLFGHKIFPHLGTVCSWK